MSEAETLLKIYEVLDRGKYFGLDDVLARAREASKATGGGVFVPTLCPQDCMVAIEAICCHGYPAITEAAARMVDPSFHHPKLP